MLRGRGRRAGRLRGRRRGPRRAAGPLPRELDLVVEGDAVAVARRAAERVNGSLHATSASAPRRSAPTGSRSTSRARARRRYPRPGALPEVTLGARHRRTSPAATSRSTRSPFSLEDEELVEWPGPPGPRRPHLRVLHERSFRDDPTRMLRLVRYAARLQFNAHPKTEALIDPGSPTR